ncbi:MAG: hypothetical protein LBJ17_07420 [Dysgonamonadaceae bacterium]|jgi:hypothetical protein|nr:hypothetical protein [Dysgonamonadaceae bacterium]
MLKAGMDWHFKKYSNDTEYVELEIQARNQKMVCGRTKILSYLGIAEKIMIDIDIFMQTKLLTFISLTDIITFSLFTKKTEGSHRYTLFPDECSVLVVATTGTFRAKRNVLYFRQQYGYFAKT